MAKKRNLFFKPPGTNDKRVCNKCRRPLPYGTGMYNLATLGIPLLTGESEWVCVSCADGYYRPKYPKNFK